MQHTIIKAVVEVAARLTVASSRHHVTIAMAMVVIHAILLSTRWTTCLGITRAAEVVVRSIGDHGSVIRRIGLIRVTVMGTG